MTKQECLDNANKLGVIRVRTKNGEFVFVLDNKTLMGCREFAETFRHYEDTENGRIYHLLDDIPDDQLTTICSVLGNTVLENQIKKLGLELKEIEYGNNPRKFLINGKIKVFKNEFDLVGFIRGYELVSNNSWYEQPDCGTYEIMNFLFDDENPFALDDWDKEFRKYPIFVGGFKVATDVVSDDLRPQKFKRKCVA